jgi:hypothetical protein
MNSHELRVHEWAEQHGTFTALTKLAVDSRVDQWLRHRVLDALLPTLERVPGSPSLQYWTHENGALPGTVMVTISYSSQQMAHLVIDDHPYNNGIGFASGNILGADLTTVFGYYPVSAIPHLVMHALKLKPVNRRHSLVA